MDVYQINGKTIPLKEFLYGKSVSAFASGFCENEHCAKTTNTKRKQILLCNKTVSRKDFGSIKFYLE
jgi:hypothetical protein